MSHSRRSKFTSARPHDYIYDPCFIVSGKKDHMKAAMTAMMTGNSFGIQPNFKSMFSDLPHRPRFRYVIQGSGGIPPCVDRSWEGRRQAIMRDLQLAKPVDVSGVDRYKFCRKPSDIDTPPQYIAASLKFPGDLPVHYETIIEEKVKDQCTQTCYRESSAQTSPWQPDYIVRPGENPEILTLAWLAWRAGLPAGMNEVRIIERARIRRAWESRLPVPKNKKDLDFRYKCIADLELDEWKFREQEIKDIQTYRFELISKIYTTRRERLHEYNEIKLNILWEKKKQYRDERFAKIKYETKRAVRKLQQHNFGISNKYKKENHTVEYINFASELHGPIRRHGVHPGRLHMKLHPSNYKSSKKGLEGYDTTPPWLFAFSKKLLNPSTSKSPCTKQRTDDTEEHLKAIHDDLKGFRVNRVAKVPNMLFCKALLKRLEKNSKRPYTPECEAVPNIEEDDYQTAIFLQKIIRGRAIQGLMFTGRNISKELIAELRSTHNLLQDPCPLRKIVARQLRFQEGIIYGEKRIKEPLDYVEANSIGFMLDFLTKELHRLKEERRSHAYTLLAIRDRRLREAAEAGRRQIEETRRREHDEMFKQVMKVHQDTVDLYLEDILMEGMDNLADHEAREYIRTLAHKIDITAHEAATRSSTREEQDLVTDMIHHFVVPEVQKEIVRDRMRQRQSKHLTMAHNIIWKTFDDLYLYGAYQGDLSPSEEALRIVKGIQSNLLRAVIPDPAQIALKIVKEIEGDILDKIVPTDSEVALRIVKEIENELIRLAIPGGEDIVKRIMDSLLKLTIPDDLDLTCPCIALPPEISTESLIDVGKHRLVPITLEPPKKADDDEKELKTIKKPPTSLEDVSKLD